MISGEIIRVFGEKYDFWGNYHIFGPGIWSLAKKCARFGNRNARFLKIYARSRRKKGALEKGLVEGFYTLFSEFGENYFFSSGGNDRGSSLKGLILLAQNESRSRKYCYCN